MGEMENGNGSFPKQSDQTNNERLLCIAFVSFMTFSILQMLAAIIAGSEALLGDSAAMMVDAFTYLLNWYAERQKRTFAQILQGGCDNDMIVLRYRKYHLQLELLPPLVSVTTLVVVIGLVLRNAIRILILDANRDVSLQADPNVNLMLLCSMLNLLLDVLNVFCFAKAKHALGYDTGVHDDEPVQEHLHLKSGQRLLDHDETGDRQKSSMEPLEIEQEEEHDHKEEANLNMCSAYTHVFADTLRSMAVIIASILADFVPAITPEEADASAAVVVTGLILLSLIPLVKGMIHTLGELQQVNSLLIDGLLEGTDMENIDFENQNGSTEAP